MAYGYMVYRSTGHARPIEEPLAISLSCEAAQRELQRLAKKSAHSLLREGYPAGVDFEKSGDFLAATITGHPLALGFFIVKVPLVS